MYHEINILVLLVVSTWVGDNPKEYLLTKKALATYLTLWTHSKHGWKLQLQFWVYPTVMQCESVKECLITVSY